MEINEEKMQIVIDNYFKQECDVNTSIREVFEKGFRIGVKKGLLSAQPERKKGRWERYNTYHGDDTSGFVDPDWRCSECGRQANISEWFIYDLTNYCPNCGAEMKEEENG